MPLKLEDLGFKVGDIVTYDCDDESTGGVIFTIAVNYDSPVPDAERNRWGRDHHDPITGKKLQPMEVNGYIRLKPIFEFFPTERGKKPKGKAGTVLVHHTTIKHWREPQIRKIDVLSIAAKYAELGHLVRDIAVMHGMVQQPSDQAHDSPQE